MSKPSTIVIIGGDAAGMSAASKAKRSLPQADVIVFERSRYISYSACGMPYWIGGVVEAKEDLLILTPEKARRKRGLDVRLRHEVRSIDRVAKSVSVYDLEADAMVEQSYDKLVIATGAVAVLPPIPGIDLPGVFALRSLADSERIKHYISERTPRRAVIIGGGYIGLEMAEAFVERKMDVDLVEMLPQLLPNFDADMVDRVTEHVQGKGVNLHLGTASSAIEERDKELVVKLNDGTELACDLVLISVGVRPNTELAVAAGLEIGAKHAIRVDDHLRTSDPDIYAAGDCVEYHHLVLDESAWIPLAPSANKGGRIAGDNLSGGDAAFPGILGTAVIKVFDYTISTTGITEHQARTCGKFGADGEFVGATLITAYDRSHYWSGAAKMQVKLVFDNRDGRILGGQLAGTVGVNKRIDIIATAISAHLSVAQLGMLDLSYAPPYSTVYDPLQICANVAVKQVGV